MLVFGWSRLFGLFVECRQQAVFNVLLWLLRLDLCRCNCGFNVELVTGQLAGEANILTTTANSDRLLVLSNEYLGALAFFVDLDRADLGWRKCVSDKVLRVSIKSDDVDLFLIADLVHDSLDASTVSPDEGTDWVNAWNG